MKTPQIIKDQPGFRIDYPMQVGRSKTEGYRLYVFVAGWAMDGSLEDVPELANHLDWHHIRRFLG